jgi:hypothetical protein
VTIMEHANLNHTIYPDIILNDYAFDSVYPLKNNFGLDTVDPAVGLPNHFSRSSTASSSTNMLFSQVPQYTTPNAIHNTKPVKPLQICLYSDKLKTRAETEIKFLLMIDPVDAKFEHMHFPRKMLARPKLFASTEERKLNEGKGESLHMNLFLVHAKAVKEPKEIDQALRLDKDDPAHPQNGDEVLICSKCKERESKRYNRKKKKENEPEWWSYENDRVIIINENEYKQWKNVESGDQQLSPSAKQVEFSMRIACYCRHHKVFKDNLSAGYRVIFTFTNDEEQLIAQQTSEIFLITDDHRKNKIATEDMRQPLCIPPQYIQTQHHTHSKVVPIYQYPIENQYPPSLGPFSQAHTSIRSNFQCPISPMEANFPPSTTPTGPQRWQNAPTFFNAVSLIPDPPFARFRSLNDTLVPNQISPNIQYPPRLVFMEDLNFSSPIQDPHDQGYNSTTPLVPNYQDNSIHHGIEDMWKRSGGFTAFIHTRTGNGKAKDNGLMV